MFPPEMYKHNECTRCRKSYNNAIKLNSNKKVHHKIDILHKIEVNKNTKKKC